MPIQTATNPETGETVALVGNQWVPIQQTASNDKGQKAYLIGNRWLTDEAEKPVKNAGFSLGDIAKSFGMGAAGSTQALTDVAGAENVVSSKLGEVSKSLQASLTPERQAELQRQQERMKAAEKEGTWAEVKAAAQNIAEAPLQSIAQGAGSFVPYLPAMFAAPAAAAMRLAPSAIKAITAVANVAPKVMGTAQGAGAVKSSIYESVYQAEKSEGATEQLARQKATAAQDYFGKNFDQIALGAGLGLAASATGVEKLLTPAGKAAAQQGIGRRVAGAMAAEAPMEGAQGGQERMAANIAQQREGRDVGTFTGVAGQATQEGLMGALSAGPVAAMRGPDERAPTAPAQPPVSEAPATEPIPVPLADRPYPELAKEVSRISQLADTRSATPEEMTQLKAMRQELQTRGEKEIREEREARTAAEEGVKRFPALAESEPDLFGEVRPPVEPKAEAAPTEGLADVISAELPATTEVLHDAGIAPTMAELEAAGQQKLPLRRTVGDRPTSPIREEKPVAPTVTPANTITATEVRQFGTMSKANRTWMEANVTGKTPEQVRDMVAADPTIPTKKPGVAAALREIIAAAAPQETPSVTTPPTPVAKQLPEPTRDKPSMGVPVEPTAAAAGIPAPAAAVAPITPGQPAAPVGLGLVPPSEPAKPRATPKGAVSTALTPLAEAPAPAMKFEVPELPAVRKAEVAPMPKIGGGMFDQLVREGTPDLVEEAAPVAKEKPDRVTPEWALGTKEEASAGKAAVASEVRQEKERKRLESLAKREAEITRKEEEAAVAKREAGVEKREAELAKREASAAKPKAEPKADTSAPLKTPVLETTEAEVPEGREKDPTVRAIDGKTVLEVANWAAENMADPDQRLIAQRVAATLRELQAAGVTLGTVTVTAPDRRLTRGKGVTTYTKPTAKSGSSVRIMLNHPNNGDQTGTSHEVVLHELIHAATIGTIYVGNLKSTKGTALGKTVDELYSVTNAVIQHFNTRVTSGEKLTDFEQRALDKRHNALADADEMLTWALSNREMQAYLEGIPYKGTTAWGKFVTLVRDMLGLKPKTDTALSELLRVGGELTSVKRGALSEASTATGKQFAISTTTKALVAGAGPVSPLEKSLLTRLVDAVKSDPTLDYATKFRTQVADIAATIESRLTAKFDGAVRDSLGELNPMGLYRQAQDYTKMLLEFLQVGGIAKEPTTGLWQVKKVAGVGAPADVYAKLKTWGEANGLSFEEANEVGSRILEGVRLDGMRTANKTGAGFVLHKIDKTSNLSIDQQIDNMLAELKANPELQAIADLMDSARIALVDHMVAVGRLSPEQGKDWREVAGYVPFDRISPEGLAAFSKVKRVSGKGLAQVGKLPELKGAIELPVGNVFNNYMDTLGWMLGQVVKTDATINTLRSLEKVTSAKYLGLSDQGKPNVVGAYVNGVMNYWEMPSKYDVMAFKDLNVPKAGWLLQLGAFSNVLRKSITALPPFALKQVTDDVQRAIMTSGVKNPGALLRMTLTNFPKLALAELRGIQHPSVREFGAMGLTGEYDFQAGKPASSLLKDLGYVPRGKVGTLLHRLDGITRASDLAVRKAIYDQTMKESGDQLLSQTRAREFINFRRRGNSEVVGAMVTTIPFFNAYIQGMDVLYRAASGKDSSSSVGRAQARRMFWGRAAIATAMSSLYALSKDDDDEEYKNMDLRTRDGNWIVGGMKLAVPGELGAIFKVIPERVVEYMRRQGTSEEQEAFEAVRTAASYIMEQYVGRVTPIPQAAKPLIEAWANKSFLTGRALEGFHQQQMDKSERVTATTSELAKAVVTFSRDVVGVEVSPIMVDNALLGYFGSTAAILTSVTDSLMNPTRVDRPLHKWALLSNYMYDPVGTRRMTEFYEERETMGKANATLNSLVKTDMDRAVVYAETHADELMLESAINSTLEQLQRTRAYRTYLNSVEGAKEMSASEREAEMKEVKKLEIELVGWVREAKADRAKL